MLASPSGDIVTKVELSGSEAIVHFMDSPSRTLSLKDLAP